MQPSGPSPRRPWSPADRDGAVRRTRRVTRMVIAGAAGLSGLFSVVAAEAFKGHASAKPRATAQVGPSVPAPQHVPTIAPAPRHRLKPPSTPPSAAAPAPPAPAPAPAATPVPAPAPPPPPPVTSGSS